MTTRTSPTGFRAPMRSKPASARPHRAMPIPADCQGEGVSRSRVAEKRTVNTTCPWETRAANPGGMPSCMPTKSREK